MSRKKPITGLEAQELLFHEAQRLFTGKPKSFVDTPPDPTVEVEMLSLLRDMVQHPNLDLSGTPERVERLLYEFFTAAIISTGVPPNRDQVHCEVRKGASQRERLSAVLQREIHQWTNDLQ